MLDSILQHANDTNPPAIYIASNSIDNHFPTLKVDNNLIFNDDAFLPLNTDDADLCCTADNS